MGFLSINTSHSGNAAVAYFDNALVKEGHDYMSEGNKVHAVWRGKVARMLGLENKKVTRADFGALVHNQHPQTGERLKPMNKDKMRAGSDWTFSAPKSVSVLMAYSDYSDEIKKAHEESVIEAMHEVESMAQVQMNSVDQRHSVDSGTLIYAMFTHETARPMQGTVDGTSLVYSDMQLHSHAFNLNISCNPLQNNRLVALEEFRARRLAPFAEAVYASSLSKRMKEMGYSVVRTGKKTWEIYGVDKTILERFSRRAREIDRIASEKNLNAKQKGELAVRTRLSKAKGVSEKDIPSIWRKLISDKELHTLQNLRQKSGAGKSLDITPDQAVERSLQDILERKSTVEKKRLISEALMRGPGTLTKEAVTNAVESRKDILHAEFDHIDYVTTQGMVDRENFVVSWAAQGKGTRGMINPEYQPTNFLNDQQKKVIRNVLSSRNNCQIIQGYGGTGKSTIIKEIVAAAKQNNIDVIGVAQNSAASRGVLKEEIGMSEADTVARLLIDKDMQARLKNNILWVDEHSLISMKDAEALIKVAQKQNARTIWSGDNNQHGAINSGSPIVDIIKRGGIVPERMTKIMRQRNPEYRRAVTEMARGDVKSGMARLDRLGAIKEIEDDHERYQHIAKSYADQVEKKNSILIVSPTHQEIETVNEFVRDELDKRGHLKGKERIFKTMKNLSWSDQDKRDPALYREGQIVAFHKPVKGGFKSGDRFEVLPRIDHNQVRLRSLYDGTVRNLPVASFDRYNVFKQQELPLRINDQIAITGNGCLIEGNKVNTGRTFTVSGYTKSGDICLENGKTLSKDYGHIRYNYCSTSHASQGRTVSKVIIAQSSVSMAASDARQAYVSASRFKNELEWVTDNKTELKKWVSRNAERMSASEVANQHYEREQANRQRQHYQDMVKRDQTGRGPSRVIKQDTPTLDKEP